MNKYISDYILFSKRKGISELSYSIYQKHLNNFSLYLEKESLSILKIQKEDIEKYLLSLSSNKYSRSFINQAITSLRGFYAFIEEKENIKNPTLDISNQKIAYEEKKIDSYDISRIIKYLENDESMEIRDRFLLLLMIQYSLNGTTLCKLKVTDLIEENDLIRLKIGDREINIESIKLQKIIKEYLNERKKINASNSELFITRSGMYLQKPHVTHIIKQMSKLLALESHSLAQLYKAKKIPTNKTNVEMIDNRYAKIKNILRTRNFELIKVVDRKMDDATRILRLYDFTKKEEKKIGPIKNEFIRMREFDHPNIIKIYDLKIIDKDKDDKTLYIAVEYFDSKILKFYSRKIELDDFISIALGLLTGLGYIHKRGLLHCDINHQTILCGKYESRLIAKYMNIGRYDSNNKPIVRLKGGNPFVAPEYHQTVSLDKRSDIFSLGVTLFHLFTGEFPYTLDFKRVKNPKITQTLSKFPDKIISMIEKMISLDPSDRFYDTASCIEQLHKSMPKEDRLETTTLTNFNLKMTKEIEILTEAISSIKEKENFVQLIKINCEDNSGKDGLLIEAQNICNIHSIPIYTVDLAMGSDARILTDIFLSDTIGNLTDESIAGATNQNEAQNQKISLFENTAISMNKKTPFVLAINNFNEGKEEFFDLFFYILKKQQRLRERILFIIAYNKESENIESSISKIFKNSSSYISIELKPISKDILLDLLSDRLTKKISNEVLDYIYETSKGNIPRVNGIVNILLKNKYIETDTNTLEINFTQAFYDSRKRDIFSNIDEFSKWILTLLVCYKNPMSKGLLKAVADSFFSSKEQSEMSPWKESLKSSSPRKRGSSFQKVGENLDSRFRGNDGAGYAPSLLTKPSSALLAAQNTELSRNNDIDNALDSMIKSGILISSIKENKKEEISFVNEYFSSLFYNQINKESESKIHNIIAEELEKSESSADNMDKIAEHYLLGNNKEKSFYYFTLKAEKSKSLMFLKDAIDSYERLDPFFDEYDRDKQIRILAGKAETLIELCKIDSAKENIESARRLAKTQAEMDNIKMLALRSMVKDGKMKEALAVLAESFYLGNNLAPSVSDMEMIILRSSLLIQLSNYSEAIDFILDMLKRDFGKETITQNLTLKNMLGLSYFLSGDCSSALNIFNDILNSLEMRENDRIKLRTLNNLGMLNYQMCNFETAIKHYTNALSITEKNYDILARATILINLAGINHRIGNLNESLNIFNKLNDIYDSIGAIQNFESVILQMGQLFMNLGVYDKAEDYQKRAEELSIEHSNHIILAYSYALKGDVLGAEGENSLALDYYYRAIDIFEKYSQSRELGQLYLNLSKIFLALERFSDGFLYLEKAKKLSTYEHLFDISLRVTLNEILFDLKTEPLQYASVNLKFNKIKENSILASDWDLKLNYLKLWAIYQKKTSNHNLARETLLEYKNELRRVSTGFSHDIREIFLTKSEFGRFIREFDQTEEKEDLERILEINLEITENLNLDIVLEKILTNILILSKADNVFLILKEVDGAFRVKSAMDKNGIELKKELPSFFDSALLKVTNQKEAVVFYDSFKKKRGKTILGPIRENLNNILAIPLLMKSRVIGLLYMEDHEEREIFKKKELKLYSLFGSQVAIAIENARNFSLLSSEKASLSLETEGIKSELEKKSIYVDSLQRKIDHDYDEIIGVSEKNKEIIEIIDKIARSDISVLITGESGTGKELVARAIHKNSNRKDKPFIAENCAGFSDNLLEAELFGYKKGAFTGADEDRKGILEIADGGTLFLDEVGEMSLNMQVKLLRFLANGEFNRIGDETTRRVEVRIISATNHNLTKMTKNGQFRLDLYHRLNQMNLPLTPLRERREDIPLLVRHFIEKYNRTKNENIYISDGVIEAFRYYSWPGNIRELENEISRLIVIRDTDLIDETLIKNDARFQII